MKCDFCKNDFLELEEFKRPLLNGKYCSEICMINMHNKIRLAYFPHGGVYAPVNEFTDILMYTKTVRGNAVAAQENFLIKDMNSDQLMAHIGILQNCINNCHVLVHKLRMTERDYNYEKVRNEIRNQVADHDGNIVKKTVDQREKDQKLKAAKQNGDKISKDGKCFICEKESLTRYCSKNCKESFLIIKGMLDLGKSLESARQVLRGMGRLPAIQ